jgi:biopolymer transport protein ExbB
MGHEILKNTSNSSMFLLQVEITHNSLLPAIGNTETMPFLNLLLKGGWVMLPILLLSILTVYAILERLIVLHSASKIPQQWIDTITAKTIEGDIQGVKMLCEQKRYAIASIIKAGIENSHKSMKTIARIIENAGQMEIHKLEKNLALLGTIAGAAPMLGFLGTVIGMIQAFMAMAQETNQISPKLLSGGIYEAMVTTAAGLVVGIMANLGYNYLLTRIQQATHRIEYAANHFIEIMGSQVRSK